MKPPLPGARIGIDLGTTNSLVAVMSGANPVVLRNVLGETLTPSAVSVTDDGTILVGAAARARAVTHSERTALAFKRDMGTERIVKLGNRSFRPEELSALVLAELKRDAETALGEPIADAVVTVPAYFGEMQRRATRAACEIAGLPVERIINEPTAAAIAYGLQERHREFRAAILDLGGGTFDVTVLEIMEGVIEIRSSAGDLKLGGDDFTSLLSDLLRIKLSREQGIAIDETKYAAARIGEAAEFAKRRLAQDTEALVPVVGLPLASGGVVSAEVQITRDEAEQVWSPLLARIEAPILRALRDASLHPRDVDEVLLVGGATRAPCIHQLASTLFGRLALRTLPPDEAIVMGAAVQAALKAGHQAVEDVVVTDIAPYTMGIATAVETRTGRVRDLYTPILERGTVLPASRVQSFFTMADMQSVIRVEVYQGEHSLCRDNVRLGEYVVEGIPAAPAGQEGIDVRFTYDLNGILDVDVTVQATGTQRTFVIDRTGGKLTKEQIDEAHRRLQTFKFHPREALPNVTALARADAMFVELTGDAREHLGSLIARFRAALDGQSPGDIERARDSLNVFVERLRRA